MNYVLQVYVQQLETSRLKLAQLEEELERTRQQKVRWRSFFLVQSLLCMLNMNSLLQGNGCLVDTSHIGFSGLVNPGL